MLELSSGIIIDNDEGTNRKFLMNIENGTVYNLNDMAFEIVESIQDGKTTEDYVEKIYNLTNGDVSKEVINNDAEKYIQDLIALGIVYEK